MLMPACDVSCLKAVTSFRCTPEKLREERVAEREGGAGGCGKRETVDNGSGSKPHQQLALLPSSISNRVTPSRAIDKAFRSSSLLVLAPCLRKRDPGRRRRGCD